MLATRLSPVAACWLSSWFCRSAFLSKKASTLGSWCRRQVTRVPTAIILFLDVQHHTCLDGEDAVQFVGHHTRVCPGPCDGQHEVVEGMEVTDPGGRGLVEEQNPGQRHGSGQARPLRILRTTPADNKRKSAGPTIPACESSYLPLDAVQRRGTPAAGDHVSGRCSCSSARWKSTPSAFWPGPASRRFQMCCRGIHHAPPGFRDPEGGS